jgi:hypothetical protein
MRTTVACLGIRRMSIGGDLNGAFDAAPADSPSPGKSRFALACFSYRYCVVNVFTELDTPSLAPVAPVDSTL